MKKTCAFELRIKKWKVTQPVVSFENFEVATSLKG